MEGARAQERGTPQSSIAHGIGIWPCIFIPLSLVTFLIPAPSCLTCNVTTNFHPLNNYRSHHPRRLLSGLNKSSNATLSNTNHPTHRHRQRRTLPPIHHPRFLLILQHRLSGPSYHRSPARPSRWLIRRCYRHSSRFLIPYAFPVACGTVQFERSRQIRRLTELDW